MEKQPMISEEELCPNDKRVVVNVRNLRLNTDEIHIEPLFNITLEIIKQHSLINAITLTTNAAIIYMQPLWHTVYKDERSKRYYFHLDYQRFKITVELLRHALRTSPRQPNQPFVKPPCQKELVIFIKKLDFKFQINNRKNKYTKQERLPYPRFTKLIIQHLLSENENVNKCSYSVPHKISEEEFMETLKFVTKGELKGMSTFEMLIPEAMMSRENGAKESKKQMILYKIKKALGEGSGAEPDSPDHSDSSDNSIWDSTDDDKTESEEDYDHEDESNKYDQEDKSVATDNKDDDNDSEKDSNAEEDQIDVSRYLNDPPNIEITELLNEPMYTDTTTLAVVPLLDTIHETKEDDFANKVENSTPANTSKKTIMQRVEEHEQKLNAHEQMNHAEAIQDSFKANMPKFVPQAVFEFNLDWKELTSIKKRSHDDHYPSKNYKGEKKMKRPKGVGGSLFEKCKDQADTSNIERFKDADELR
uniref:Uncharacterized protein n=1 Tax=Tanacetum cinerariifolium TaxID=118510 RepID=A0A6L2L0Y1_TANCI|nr:hypothetical protein [Tanacetum cinerariifolium]